VTLLEVSLPNSSEMAALFAVKLLLTREEIAPVIVACFALSWVWIAEVTPATVANSEALTLLTVTLPLASDTRALLAARLLETVGSPVCQ